MSGAPTFLTPISIDQPIGQDLDGKLVYPSMWFSQMIERVLALLGQPVSSGGVGGGSGGGLTISQQISDLNTAVEGIGNAPGAAAAGLNARLAALEAAFATRPWLPTSLARTIERFRPAAPLRKSAPISGPASTRGKASPTWQPAPPLIAQPEDHQMSWFAGQDPNNLVIWTAPRATIVTGIVGRLEIAEGAPADITIVRAADGTAISVGTAVASAFDADGTPATNQVLTLSATIGDLALAAGDSIGVQTTGAWTMSTGGITVTTTD